MSQLFPYNDNKGKLSWKLLQHKHKVLLKYLTKHYYPVALHTEVKSQQESQYKDCIWTAWLQGEENAPESIRMTLASIRKNVNGHQVIVRTRDTIDQFVDVPQAIKEKHQRGIIGNAHYADVARMMILAKYGGLWMDATMMLHEPIDEALFLKEFYSLGTPNTEPSRFVSDHKWIVGIVGGSKDSNYLKQISAMLNAYWCENVTCIDYFVFDYLIAALYQNDKSFSKIVDDLPRMRYYCTFLHGILNNAYDENTVNELLADGQIYTVTYKQNYKKSTADGQETIYGHLFQLFLNEGEK